MNNYYQSVFSWGCSELETKRNASLWKRARRYPHRYRF